MVPFTTLRAFNSAELRPLASCRGRVDARALTHFSSAALVDRLVRALAQRRAITIKEMVESFEFFGRIRRRLRAPHLVDFGAGHGLAGILFAVFAREVEQVVLIDRCKPPSHAEILAAIVGEAPWVADKVVYIETTLNRSGELVPSGASIIGVHCCGKRSDHVIDLAVAARARLALMGCCYSSTVPGGLEAIERELGSSAATDIDRTYRLRAAGYDVDWSYVPEAVTPMNRIIVATPASRSQSS